MSGTLALKQKLQKQGLRGLALDIDETLSDSHPHWFEHMKKFHAPANVTDEDAMRKYRESWDHFPEWQTEEARVYIREALGSNEFNEVIPLLHESNKMVKELSEIIPVVAYITARWETVRPATERWLKQHGFPPVDLIMNVPNSASKTRNHWKAAVLKELYPEVIGIVDDSPDLPDALGEIGYKGKVFVYGEQARDIRVADYPFEVILSPNWNHVLDYFQSSKSL